MPTNEEREEILVERVIPEDAHCTRNFQNAVKHVLGFKRVIALRKDRDKFKRFFRNIKVGVDFIDVLNYPGYLRSLTDHGRNPLDYMVMIVRRGFPVQVSSIPSWIDRAKNFY